MIRHMFLLADKHQGRWQTFFSEEVNKKYIDSVLYIQNKYVNINCIN